MRAVVLSANFLLLVGCILKNVALDESLFGLLMFGQLLTQMPRSVSITYAGQLANLWCKSEEISRGTSMGISGFILGFCLGYIIPPAVIEDQNETLKSINATENDVLNEFDSEKFKAQDGLFGA